MSARKVLVVGAQPHSFGDHIVRAIRAVCADLIEDPEARWEVVTAGMAGEAYDLDLYGDAYATLIDTVSKVNPDHIVCTAGINQPKEKHAMLHAWYEEHFQVNVVGPMRLLEAWLAVLDGDHQAGMPRHYVAISSNSAHIARTYSGAYCASKAALSMALRCKARELQGHPVSVYGYEPGLLRGTPMTDEVAARLPGRPLSRIPGQPDGLPTWRLAAMVAHNLAYGSQELNGCMLRVDGGDQ